MARTKPGPASGQLRAAIYVRISKDQTDERAGVQRQRKIAERICKERGWFFGGDDDLFEDNDITAALKAGRGRRRPAFERLLEIVDTEGGSPYGVIVAVDLDRLTRSWTDLLKIHDACVKNSVRIVLEDEGEWDPASGEGELMMGMRALIAAEEVRKMRRRRQRKADEDAVKGRSRLGGQRLFGYDKDRTAVVPDEAQLIRDAIELFLGGASKGEVVRFMREQGPPPVGKGTWVMTNAMRLLNSAALAGIREHHTKDPVKRYYANFEATWHKIAIIDRETHERVRAEIVRRRDSAVATRGLNSKRGGTPSPRRLLSGVARCGLCGATLSSQPKLRNREGQPVPSYRCPQRNGANGQKGCGRIRIQGEDFDAYVIETLLAFATHPDVIKRRIADTSKLTVREREIHDQLEALDKEQRALEMMAANGLPTARYRALQDDIKRRRENAEKQRVALRNSIEPELNRGHMDEIRARWAELTLTVRRNVLVSLLGENTREGAEAHWRARRDAGLPVEWKHGEPPVFTKSNKPPKDLFVGSLVVHPGLQGRNTFDPRRIEIYPDWGPLLDLADTAREPKRMDLLRYSKEMFETTMEELDGKPNYGPVEPLPWEKEAPPVKAAKPARRSGSSPKR